MYAQLFPAAIDVFVEAGKKATGIFMFSVAQVKFENYLAHVSISRQQCKVVYCVVIYIHVVYEFPGVLITEENLKAINL